MVFLKTFRIDLVVAVAALVVALLYGGPSVMATTALLIVVEVVFSFDNATINAKYLRRMNDFWQKIFLTVGVLVAVVGMRLLFPFIVVCLAGSVSPTKAISLAVAKGDPNTPGTYGYILEHAHPAIAGFGGAFLLMLFCGFIFDGERDVLWLRFIERPLQHVGKLNAAPVVVTGAFLAFVSNWLVPNSERYTVLLAGVFGILLFLLVDGATAVVEEAGDQRAKDLGVEEGHVGTVSTVALAGRAALTLFIFLEVMDASFSFDGVIGAFAITADPIVIALGLGVGALVVRTLTIHLVRTGALDELRYLEHGAHWAIGALAVLLLLSTRFALPSLVVGLVGITFIIASFISSKVANSRDTVTGEKDDHELLEPQEI